MNKRILAATLLVSFSGAVLGGAPAFAQATRTWVSGVGDDVNPCSRTAPCKTFAGAISKTAAKGEINALDAGGFGAVTITKAITIDGGGSMSSILASGTNGIVVNAAASDVVHLRNIDLQGAGTGLNGIRFLAGDSLIVENVRISGFTQKGISFEPSGGSRLFVSDSTIANNLGAAAGGIQVQPGAAGSALVNLVKVVLTRNNDGLRVLDRGRASILESTMSGNSNGVVAQCATAVCEINIQNSIISDNVNGVATSGAQATIRLSNTGIYSNTTGISISGGAVRSFGTNQNAGNTTPGAPTSVLPNQ